MAGAKTEAHAAHFTVRRLAPSEWPAAYPLAHVLRPHLGLAEFLERVRRQSYGGYELAGAFRGETLAGLIGMRPVHTLSRGPYLHVDDLVVDEAARKTGAGAALMAFAEADARARGMAFVYLDARKTAIGFYESLGYAFDPAPSMRKAL